MRSLKQRARNAHDQNEQTLNKDSLCREKFESAEKNLKVLSHTHVYSLEQRARNAHDQNEQTLNKDSLCRDKFESACSCTSAFTGAKN